MTVDPQPSPPANIAIMARDLHKAFHGLTAVDGISLEVTQGKFSDWLARTAPARPPPCVC